MFTIHMLDAGHGDCLWIEYGVADNPKRILIDAGTTATYGKSLLPKLQRVIDEEGGCVIELFVVTHIDEDHIGGALRFLDELDPRVRIKEIWFNGYFHLSNNRPSVLGVLHGEKLTELIRRGGWPWNRKYDNLAVMVPEAGTLRTVSYAGMKLTVLSPTLEKLQKLKVKWEDALVEAGLKPGEAFADADTVLGGGFLGDDVEFMASTPFKQDATPANGSSIAFLAEYDGVRVLFGADAHPSVLVESAQRAPYRGNPVQLDAFKLPHHGSRKNVSTPMLEAFPATHYLISTDGARFEHPDAEAIARVVVLEADAAGKELHFNCESTFNKQWSRQGRKDKYGYSASFGEPGEGLVVELQ